MARQNTTLFAILGMLSYEPASGYDIKKKMANSTDHFWAENDGALYPMLNQLLQDGLVSCEADIAQTGKPKKIYAITETGQIKLNYWLAEDPQPHPSRNEFLLKIFFGWNVDSEITMHHIKSVQFKLQNKLKDYQARCDKVNLDNLSTQQLHGYLTLKAGINALESRLKWCDEALELLLHANQ